MNIRSVRHRGVRRLLEQGDHSGVPAVAIPKLRRILSFLGQMSHEDELRLVASWKAHQLTGDRKGMWSLHVTRNWRLTFAIDPQTTEIFDLDDEDYH